jgi:hypothetical protein
MQANSNVGTVLNTCQLFPEERLPQKQRKTTAPSTANQHLDWLVHSHEP